MTRICVISDSHVNAIKSGWDLIEEEFQNIELTFFAAAKDAMMSLQVSAGQLIPSDPRCARRMRSTSNGLEAIDNGYDWYLLVGLLFDFNYVVRFCMKHRIECEEVDDRKPVSNECFECAVEDRLRESIAIATVPKLRRITQAPISVVAAPLRTLPESTRGLQRVRASGADKIIREIAYSAAKRLSEQYMFNLVLQPENTFSSPLITSGVYAHAPGSIDAHMNADYGREVLSSVLRENSPSLS